MTMASTWHITTSSGLVLLCSFWCHSSIIPPLQLFFLWKKKNQQYNKINFDHLRFWWMTMKKVTCITNISSRMRWPTSPSPPRPTAAMIMRTIARHWGKSRYRFWSRSVNLSWALLISLPIVWFTHTKIKLQLLEQQEWFLQGKHGLCYWRYCTKQSKLNSGKLYYRGFTL